MRKYQIRTMFYLVGASLISSTVGIYKGIQAERLVKPYCEEQAQIDSLESRINQTENTLNPIRKEYYFYEKRIKQHPEYKDELLYNLWQEQAEFNKKTIINEEKYIRNLKEKISILKKEPSIKSYKQELTTYTTRKKQLELYHKIGLGGFAGLFLLANAFNPLFVGGWEEEEKDIT